MFRLRSILVASLISVSAGFEASAQSIARVWNEELLAAVRLSFPDPPVHARNLFHVSVAMWDAWAAYDSTAVGYLHRETATSADVAAARHEAISYACYRVLSHRYTTVAHPNTPGASVTAAQANFDARMALLGYSTAVTTTVGAGPAAVGNRVAATILGFTAGDGSNEAGGYTDGTYTAVNDPLILANVGTTMNDPNRWQPLQFVTAFSQTGQPLNFTTQEFIGAHWREAWPFALSRAPGETLYLDPGPPPQLGGTGDAEHKAGVAEVVRYSSLLDATIAPTLDASPGAIGNNTLGANDGTGHPVNPATGLAYASNPVNEADFGRVLAEFWADGPESETPPGHWNVLANEVVDHPDFERRFEGVGPELDPLEWDVKLYFLINAAVHDAAVAAWTCKREYDFVRPISSIRYMGLKGQCSDSNLPSYDPEGLPLIPGLIELVTAESTQFGARHRHLGLGAIGRIAIFTWPGEPAIPATQASGVEWILADRWVPYQRDTFVTPAFAGYLSGHSTFSRAAAEVLTRLTGSAFFPGGLGTHDVPAGSLDFEYGPSAAVQLQWATYYDAADQAGISRLYGGIHVPVDDGPGRIMGAQCGIGAWNLGCRYFDGSVLTERPQLSIVTVPGPGVRLDWSQFRGLNYRLRSSSGTLSGFIDLLPSGQATQDRGSHVIDFSGGMPERMFFTVEQSE